MSPPPSFQWRFWRRSRRLPDRAEVQELADAKRSLRAAEANEPRVRKVVDETRARRVDNHLGHQFTDAFYLGRRRHP